MCFHGNQLSWGIKHPIISLYSKYHSLGFIRFPVMLAPVISSLDGIYCSMYWKTVIVCSMFFMFWVSALTYCMKSFMFGLLIKYSCHLTGDPLKRTAFTYYCRKDLKF